MASKGGPRTVCTGCCIARGRRFGIAVGFEQVVRQYEPSRAGYSNLGGGSLIADTAFTARPAVHALGIRPDNGKHITSVLMACKSLQP